MYEIFEYLRARYLTEKAQGMVEYALILAFVVVIAAALTSGGGLSEKINTVIDAVKTNLTVNKSNP